MRVNNLETNKNQDGFASIVIAIILVLVLSLVTVGFAQLMNREQRQALDKQLSSQAYYAAESGVNDAVKAINAGYTQAKTDCGPIAESPSVPGSAYLSNNKVGQIGGADENTTDASYPCLLINPTPPTLEFGSVDIGKSRALEMEGRDKNTGEPVLINSVEISWEDPNDGTSFVPAANSDCTSLPPATANGSDPKWTYTGMLKMQLIPISPAFLSRDLLSNFTATAYLCPNDGTGTPTTTNYLKVSGSANAGLMVKGNCNQSAKPDEPRYCNAIINNLSILGAKTFFLDLRSIYNPTRVTVKAYGIGSVSSATQLNIAQAQTLVDSTGKSHDVLRRIQVRVPAHNSYAIPDGTTASICKQLSLYPNQTTTPSSSECPLP
jgi:hypothetical protein